MTSDASAGGDRPMVTNHARDSVEAAAAIVHIQQLAIKYAVKVDQRDIGTATNGAPANG